MNERHSIPPSVVTRMTKYLAYVQSLTEKETEWVSSAELAETLGLTSSTVRQDLSHLDFCGTSKRGYETTGLVDVLREALGANMRWRMVVVGAGNLGRALAQHEDFERRDFHICGIFDNDSAKIGTKVGNLKVQGMRELPHAVAKLNVQIGLIAVPAPAAQGVADLLIASRIKGLLNMALTHIVAPRDVAVVDTRIAASLLELSFAIKASSESKRSARGV
jgi:redox-sensing transcriptional repressor